MKPVDGPVPNVSRLANRPAAQTAAWGQDRSNLAACKPRLDGAQTILRTERALLVGPAPEGSR